MKIRTIRQILFLTLLLTAMSMQGQTPIVKPDLSVPSLVAPAYFGPNAFPVPDMSDGSTSPDLEIELYGDGFFGCMTSRPSDDLTFDLFARVRVPLFTPRVNLVVWMPVVEYFRSGPQVNALRRIAGADAYISGFDSGDAYISTEILVLDEKKRGCGLVLRSVLKSASGNSFSTARVYDSPGYFFDLTAGREMFSLRGERGGTSLRVALSGGFLCWQTANGRQNDAVMYGVLAALKSGPFKVEVDYGGYVGWEGYGDRPMTLKTKMGWTLGAFSINAMCQVGFMDWPFHQLRLGAAYNIPICR